MVVLGQIVIIKSKYILSHRKSFFGDFIFLSIAGSSRPSIFENNRTKFLSLVILGLYTLYNRPSLAQQLHSRPEIVIILMK